ncbi:MAG TPA: hypothetical protein VMF61_08795 [Candidatus Acidoferrales bacterium]|nr:hypothetical protein [Candidatus Acidoferrales bacterium]
MRSQNAFGLTLVAMAAALGAAAAHVTIDVAGDYLLAHDAYDGMAHHSRALLLAAVAVGALAFLVRATVDALQARCTSRTSLLGALRNGIGSPWTFCAAVVPLTVVLLVGMEWFDCATLGVRVDDLGDLFGGSLLLGAASCVVCGALAALALHRIVRVAARAEAFIVRVAVAIVRRRTTPPLPIQVLDTAAAAVLGAGGILLARRGRKRGPPLAISG